MLKLMVCDDNPDDLKSIKKTLSECRFSDDFEVVIFQDPQKAMEHIKEGKCVDIIFLDIYMPEKDGTMSVIGIHLANELREAGYSGFIVFLTNSNDFAAQSYQVNAFSYLLKPALKQDVQILVEKIIKSSEKTDNSGFSVKRKSGTRFVCFSELMYVEVSDHNLFFCLASGEVLKAYASMREYADILLAEERMARPHRSFVVNLDFVAACEKGDVVMKDNYRIPLHHGIEKFRNQVLHWHYGRKER